MPKRFALQDCGESPGKLAPSACESRRRCERGRCKSTQTIFSSPTRLLLSHLTLRRSKIFTARSPQARQKSIKHDTFSAVTIAIANTVIKMSLTTKEFLPTPPSRNCCKRAYNHEQTHPELVLITGNRGAGGARWLRFGGGGPSSRYFPGERWSATDDCGVNNSSKLCERMRARAEGTLVSGNLRAN